MSTFSERLSETMADQRYNNSTLGKALGVTHSTVSRWLSGSTPSGETLHNLARILNVNAQWLISQTGPKRDPTPENVQAMSDAIRSKDYQAGLNQHAAMLKPEDVLQGMKTLIESADPSQPADVTISQVAAFLAGAGKL